MPFVYEKIGHYNWQWQFEHVYNFQGGYFSLSKVESLWTQVHSQKWR